MAQKLALDKIEQISCKKKQVLQNSVTEYLVRAMMASAFIGMGVVISFKTGQLFYNSASPLTSPVSALTFSIALILISFAGGELFTGNTFYFTYSTLRKKVSWRDTFNILTLSYIGNLIGAILFSVMIFYTGIFHGLESHTYLTSLVEKKMSSPFLMLFFKGVLCNWMVCLAFLIPQTMKDDLAKIVIMVMLVFGFFIAGFEHSIANMSLFSIALLNDPTELITIGGAIRNLIPVSLGNMVGGSVFLGFAYYYLEGRKKE